MAVLTQNTGVYSSRLTLYQFKFNISSLSRFIKAQDRNHRWISTPTSPFSMKQVPILKENELVLWLLWPKTHVCVVIDQDYTIPKSILVD